MNYMTSRRSMTESKFRGLASELLANIFSSLPRRDLVHVVLVCKSFNLSGCLLLYQHVDLRSDDLYIRSTLDLLRNHESIEKKIVSAVLTTMPTTMPHPYSHSQSQDTQLVAWINPYITKRWSNLKSLKLRGYPFSDIWASDVFLNTLHNSCQQLRYFTYRPEFGALPSNFDLTGLQGVTWHSGPGTEDMPIIPTLSSSRHAITRISFTGTIVFRSDRQYYIFLDLRFPSLEYLELGSLVDANDAARANTKVTEFILAHPRIEHLSLGRTRPAIDNGGPGARDSFFQFDGSLLRRESLPSLKSFEGFLENISMLARHAVNSLFSINSLSICCPYQERKLMEKVLEMQEAVTQAHMTLKKFPFVTYLRFELFAELHHMMPLNTTSLTHRTCMDHLSQLCPGVVSWYGRLPPMTSEHLSSMFGMYDNVETISLPQPTLFIHIGSSELAYFRPIAVKCTNLKKVIARKLEYTEEKNQIFMLNRDADGNLTSVTFLATPDEPCLH